MKPPSKLFYCFMQSGFVAKICIIKLRGPFKTILNVHLEGRFYKALKNTQHTYSLLTSDSEATIKKQNQNHA